MTCRGSAAVLASALLCSLGGRASAQTLDTVVTVAGGTGLSIGRGTDGVARRRSPVLLELEVGLIFDGDRRLEWTPGVIVELDDRVSVGVNPAVKWVRPVGALRGLSIYAGAGVPFIFAPFTLFGAEAAVGGIYQITEMVGVALELRADVFFAGSDLPDDGILAKLDVAVGLRLGL